MSKLNILVLGENGSGKSTTARVVMNALKRAGFKVELNDDDDASDDRIGLRLTALQGTTVTISCGNVKVPESITPLERSLGRSERHRDMSPQEQWEDDKRNGILDWDGSEGDALKIQQRRGQS